MLKYVVAVTLWLLALGQFSGQDLYGPQFRQLAGAGVLQEFLALNPAPEVRHDPPPPKRTPTVRFIDRNRTGTAKRAVVWVFGSALAVEYADEIAHVLL